MGELSLMIQEHELKSPKVRATLSRLQWMPEKPRETSPNHPCLSGSLKDIKALVGRCWGLKEVHPDPFMKAFVVMCSSLKPHPTTFVEILFHYFQDWLGFTMNAFSQEWISRIIHSWYFKKMEKQSTYIRQSACELDLVVHMFNPSTQQPEAGILLWVWASLVYTVSFRWARAMYRTLSEKKNQ